MVFSDTQKNQEQCFNLKKPLESNWGTQGDELAKSMCQKARVTWQGIKPEKSRSCAAPPVPHSSPNNANTDEVPTNVDRGWEEPVLVLPWGVLQLLLLQLDQAALGAVEDRDTTKMSQWAHLTLAKMHFLL